MQMNGQKGPRDVKGKKKEVADEYKESLVHFYANAISFVRRNMCSILSFSSA